MNRSRLPKTVTAENVLRFVRAHVEPVSHKALITHFCTSEKANNDTKAKKLNKILVKSINEGKITHCNNFFFTKNLLKDVERFVDLDEPTGLVQLDSSFSLNSTESYDMLTKAEARILGDLDD